MKKISKSLLSFLLVFSFLLAGCSSDSKGDASASTPKYIFYFIGDGMGTSHRALAEGYQQWKKDKPDFVLGMNDMPVTASLTTDSLSSAVTDSAAAGTALSTGLKTGTGIIGMDEDAKVEYKTILEALQDEGMSVGLTTTVSITHATPAAFGAHIADRNDEATIAEQYLEAEYDYLAGGGSRYFLSKDNGGKREGDDNLVDEYEKAGYEIDTNLKEYGDTDFKKVDKYLGIYEDKYLTDAITQTNSEKTSPTLAEMVSSGIDVLSQNDKGFFMMVEGGFIDGAAHNNDAPTVLQEVLAFEASVQVALDFYEKYPDDTLILVTADHETGGLSLGYNSYSINYEELDKVTVSYGKAMESYLVAEDYEGFYKAIEEGWNVELTDADKEDILKRIKEFPIADLAADIGVDPAELESFESMRHMMGIGGYAAAPVLARKTKIGWSTQAHTGEPVLLTVIGAGSDKFSGCFDITDVPINLAKLMDVKIGK